MLNSVHRITTNCKCLIFLYVGCSHAIRDVPVTSITQNKVCIVTVSFSCH